MKENALYFILGAVAGLGILYLLMQFYEVANKISDIYSFLNTQEICQQY